MTGGLQRFLSRHCSSATMERLVDPILTDIRVEAATAGRWTSLWIHGAGVAALVKALAMHGWTRFWRFREWPDDDCRAVIRTLAWVQAAFPVVPPTDRAHDRGDPLLDRLIRGSWQS
jgi:hypothetical protein